jgi:hypothetical protein
MKVKENTFKIQNTKKGHHELLTNSTSPHLVRAWVWPTLLRATALYIPTSTFEAGSNLRIERPSASSRIFTRWLSVMTRSFLRRMKQKTLTSLTTRLHYWNMGSNLQLARSFTLWEEQRLRCSGTKHWGEYLDLRQIVTRERRKSYNWKSHNLYYSSNVVRVTK